jgi:hypothetical protein
VKYPFQEVLRIQAIVPIPLTWKKAPELNISSACPNLESQRNLRLFRKSFDGRFQEEFRGDNHREGRGIAEKILDISSNDEYSANSLVFNMRMAPKSVLEEVWAEQLCLSVLFWKRSMGGGRSFARG